MAGGMDPVHFCHIWFQHVEKSGVCGRHPTSPWCRVRWVANETMGFLHLLRIFPHHFTQVLLGEGFCLLPPSCPELFLLSFFKKLLIMLNYVTQFLPIVLQSFFVLYSLCCLDMVNSTILSLTSWFYSDIFTIQQVFNISVITLFSSLSSFWSLFQ